MLRPNPGLQSIECFRFVAPGKKVATSRVDAQCVVPRRRESVPESLGEAREYLDDPLVVVELG